MIGIVNNRGAPKKRYKDSLKTSLKACHINPSQWSALAEDCVGWRHTVHEAVTCFEEERTSALVNKRLRKKERQKNRTPTTNKTLK